MGNTKILIVSILSLLGVIAFNLMPDRVSQFPPQIKLATLIIAIILWIINIFLVYSDAKSKQKSPGWAGLTLVLGGVGGLIYYFVAGSKNQ